ncbi:hypothetical protein COS86_05095 [Candidatus Bathyarchaeota archaeon CG07_land_8_20_14_0_80_47_9]|nr:MAG: hypothetical protein COS86_05095 [Candidatus Bathyarchaeota archaeon CG07_land_8_20_14_0_80_47_9]
MAFFTSREIAAIAMSAALWSVLSAYITPIFWRATHLPFLCDMLGIISLILVTWWVRKFGAATITGIIATIITLMLNPYATQFLGFTAASVAFDVLTRLIGYQNCLQKSLASVISSLSTSVTSTALAGVIIGNLFMSPNSLVTMFGGLAFFVGLHAAGGAIGGIFGLMLVKALSTRISLPKV